MDNQVCPNCGNDRFIGVRLIYQTTYFNSLGEVIDTSDESMHPDHCMKYKCTDCNAEYDSIPDDLVDEAYFHEVIALEDVNEDE